ncbi:MAG: tetratricopeptide repeat protein [Myxococcaceae bacterium]
MPPLLLAAVGLAAYWKSFAVPFQFDDLPHIVDNPGVHLERLGASTLWEVVKGSTRPVASLSFALNHYAGGLRPFSWHLVNLAFHVASGLFVFLLGIEVLRRAAPTLDQAGRSRAALVSAVLFVAHPVQTQAVTYVVQRMASMGACFAFASAWVYFRARARPAGAHWRFALSAGLAALAMGCKENFALLPAVLLTADALLIPGFADRLRRHRWLAAAALIVLAGAGVALFARYLPTVAAEQARFGISPWARLLTEARVVWLYLSLLVYPDPSRLRVDYDYPVSASLLDPPSTLVAIVALAILVAAAIGLRRRLALFGFAVLWFLGNLLVESTVLPLDLVFEHRVYFPSFGPVLLIAYGLERGVRSLRFSPWAAAAPLAAVLIFATDRRNELWRDPVRLHEQAAAGGPATGRSLLTLGAEYYLRGDLARARTALLQVLEREPGNPGALSNLGNIARDQGDPGAAEQYYRRALAASPAHRDAQANLAGLLLTMQRLDEAQPEIDRLIQRSPRDPAGLVLRGLLFARRREWEAARGWFDAALRADTTCADAYRFRARVSFEQGRPAEAIVDGERGLTLRPADAGARLELAGYLAASGRAAEALRQLDEVLRRDPARRDVHFKKGNLLAEAGDTPAAEREYQAEVGLAPHSGALNNLGNLWRERDRARAREYYRRALEVDPGNQTAAANLAASDG